VTPVTNYRGEVDIAAWLAFARFMTAKARMRKKGVLHAPWFVRRGSIDASRSSLASLAEMAGID